MPKQYTKEQSEELFEKLPTEIQEAIFSLETAENIWNVCEPYGILDGRVGQVAIYVSQVLMGLLSPLEFQTTLQQEIGLPKVLAQAITHEINRFIFYPLKPALEGLYKIDFETPSIKTNGPSSPGGVKPETKPEETSEKDTYREPVE